ncbi:MAG TPA: bifunctional UDP-3-O-[3-hydroxymyristoyl] N-acetylglucosamine deacetylase/3-hydroxyacyl-ACP dehydratase [Candidatus Hydrogenedentes bacterium]|nr:bifunctional UDP-3-O-[3-hydroxymyristoyl] N-acetylglucosamine deacetylase/3-hydroxyacyl-ACP dehydratase [Candidatus Hydrogenedentota bacterium]HIJ74654.1 bifunctional UDP-3-O-[3-hydroxymyristoyl] N-acetylglucosamine deacetylase/3-hydroxyacyl-ACP dehydratase [Candidatus Hydrogenedentota bacterium]
MEKQQTVREEASISGVGVHTGNLTTVTFKPAPPNSGVTFYRTDLPGKPAIKADIDHVIDVSRGTTIGIDGARIGTVEHVLAAIAGLGIDNLAIEVDGNETPNADGSSLPFMNTLKKAGIVEQNAERKYIKIVEPLYYRHDDVTLSVLPADELRVSLTVSYDHVAIGTQYASFTITPEVFAKEIAPARTFCFLREVKMLQEQGLIKGGSLESAVVIGDEAILNDDLRYPDEPVRHKVLDLLGDMFLLGRPLKGHVVAVKPGHARNVAFSQQIKKRMLNGQTKPRAAGAGNKVSGKGKSPKQLDVNVIMKVLPHRYPFLLVDRILSYEPGERVVGIKNVTVNEPFFQGHWPGLPVMPGVLIIEVMAQVSSVLVFGEDAEPGKIAIFLGIDKAKFRGMIVPGDQIIVECELLRLRRNACKVHAVAKVEDRVAAEADMLFGFMETDS